MTGVEGGRIGAWGALPPPAGDAYRHARRTIPQHWTRLPGRFPPDSDGSAPPRTNAGRGATAQRFSIGFLTQVIAQETLVLDARPKPVKPDLANQAYRRAQGDSGPRPGLVTRLDVTV